ncbi:MAG: RNA polymerase sigma-70 factor [Tannerellaceae bacterium]|jgi:RNA polymerase sigma-70 factor (ECF subfamily)|nr:RNA polymerase sigma-70 factor [Tannerellaceae bacterium]
MKEKEILEIFGTLYKKFAPVLISYASRFVDSGTAEDLVQDIFLKAWHKHSFIFQKEGIKTYLYNAVRHACLDDLKHQEVKARYENSVCLKLKIEELYYTDDPDFLFMDDSRLTAIYDEIEKLPTRCREIFVMAYLEERKSGEIAVLLNLSKRTVEAQLYKALKTIREALQSRLSSHAHSPRKYIFFGSRTINKNK